MRFSHGIRDPGAEAAGWPPCPRRSAMARRVSNPICRRLTVIHVAAAVTSWAVLKMLAESRPCHIMSTAAMRPDLGAPDPSGAVVVMAFTVPIGLVAHG